jgi:hypothetical protein
MMKRAVAVVLVFLFTVLATHAIAAEKMLSEVSAKSKAVKILMGDPYGKNKKEVEKHIKSVKLLKNGTEDCGGIKTPVYEIHVVVPVADIKNQDTPLDGKLYIDAKNGNLQCAGLPYLD